MLHLLRKKKTYFALVGVLQKKKKIMLHILERLKKDQNLNKVINIHRNDQTIKLSENNPFYNSLNSFIKKSLQFLVKMVENDRLPFNYVHFQKLLLNNNVK